MDPNRWSQAVYTTRDRKRLWRSFGEHLRREIHASGLNRRAAADLFDINIKEIYQMRAGDLGPPSLERLEKWSLILDVDRDVMFSWAGVVSPDVIEILAEHPVLCKKIRNQGPGSFLTLAEKRLEGELRRGKKRKVKDGSN